jgi:hypothetical protein
MFGIFRHFGILEFAIRHCCTAPKCHQCKTAEAHAKNKERSELKQKLIANGFMTTSGRCEG